MPVYTMVVLMVVLEIASLQLMPFVLIRQL